MAASSGTKKKWIQKATKEMKKKGTVGSFTALAKKEGGYDEKNKKIKSSFIEKKTHSFNPKVRAKANFAKNVRKG